MRVFGASVRLAFAFFLIFAGSLSAQQVWDGTWSGTTVQAKAISITVSSNRIMTFIFGGHIVGVGCSADFDATTTFTTGMPVGSNGSFSINAPSSVPGGIGYSASGMLGTDGNGSGTLNFNLNSIPGAPSCPGSGSASWNVTRQGGPPPSSTQDFTVSVAPSSINLTPGGAGQVVTFHTSGANFTGPITIVAPSVANVTFSPASFVVNAGGSPPVTVSASPGASASTTTPMFGATATINGSATTKSVPLTITIAPPAAAQVSGILVAVGSLQGGFGSFFRTGLQLHNPRSTPISGKLVFHPAGTPGADSDAALAYTLNGGQTIDYADLLPFMGKSGLGSMDLIVISGTAPLMIARIYNDAGAAGTTGMAIDQIEPSSALAPGDTGIILGPSDPSKFRLNIGIRTLGSGATMQVIVRDRNGVQRNSVTRSYGANYFEQVGVAVFTGIDLLGSDSIAITINSGNAVVYGAATDNTTQDPTMQYAKKPY